GRERLWTLAVLPTMHVAWGAGFLVGLLRGARENVDTSRLNRHTPLPRGRPPRAEPAGGSRPVDESLVEDAGGHPFRGVAVITGVERRLPFHVALRIPGHRRGVAQIRDELLLRARQRARSPRGEVEVEAAQLAP